MRGQPIVAVNKGTGKLMPITQVFQTGLKCGCVCYDCGDVLEAVLNTPFQKHFRHSNKSNCNPTPESQLHLMAKVIIEQSSSIFLPGRGMVDYTEPVCEVRCDDLVPDATITVDGQLVYIEIVVTNPIHPPKVEKYREKQATVLVIRLTEEARDLDFDTLRYVVLEDEDVRGMLVYAEADLKITSNESGGWWLLGAIGLLGVFLWDRYGSGGRRKRR